MLQAAPTSEFLLAVLWLGHSHDGKTALPVGSGVVVHRDDDEYLVTALHVAKGCNFSPLIRRNGGWRVPSLEFVAMDKDIDIAVFKSLGNVRLSRLTPRYGLSNALIGTMGRAMGFPTTGKPEQDTEYIVEISEDPIPICALICSYANVSKDFPATSVAAGYINRGFSGGAVLFPTKNDWTIAGIITDRLSVPAGAVRIDKDGKPLNADERIYTQEPSGLIRYTNFHKVEQLIDNNQ